MQAIPAWTMTAKLCPETALDRQSMERSKLISRLWRKCMCQWLPGPTDGVEESWSWSWSHEVTLVRSFSMKKYSSKSRLVNRRDKAFHKYQYQTSVSSKIWTRMSRGSTKYSIPTQLFRQCVPHYPSKLSARRFHHQQPGSGVQLRRERCWGLEHPGNPTWMFRHRWCFPSLSVPFVLSFLFFSLYLLRLSYLSSPFLVTASSGSRRAQMTF